MDSPQPDMFDPLHVALLRESNYYTEKAAPFVKRANELRAAAYAACPHDLISSTNECYEDEYGSWVDGWTEIHVECDFCDKQNWMDLRKFNDSGMTKRELLLREREK